MVLHTLFTFQCRERERGLPARPPEDGFQCVHRSTLCLPVSSGGTKSGHVPKDGRNAPTLCIETIPTANVSLLSLRVSIDSLCGGMEAHVLRELDPTRAARGVAVEQLVLPNHERSIRCDDSGHPCLHLMPPRDEHVAACIRQRNKRGAIE